MYQYKVEKVTRLKGTNQVTAVLDLGFSIKMKVTFKLGRIEAPDFDFTSDIDPARSVISSSTGSRLHPSRSSSRWTRTTTVYMWPRFWTETGVTCLTT
jgi:hypothetical protein